MLRIIFYDIQGEIIDQKITHGYQLNFTYPYAATRYEVQLINGGCRSITFWRLELKKSMPNSQSTLCCCAHLERQ